MDEDYGWGMDPWGTEGWGSPDDTGPGGEEIEIEKVDGVVESPGVFTFQVDD